MTDDCICIHENRCEKCAWYGELSVSLYCSLFKCNSPIWKNVSTDDKILVYGDTCIEDKYKWIIQYIGCASFRPK